MVTIVDDLDSLSLQEAVFKDVKYYLSGDVSERIMQLLQSGGAESTKYFSDYVTHLICGPNAADTDLDDAKDIYQIPAVTENWVLACIRLKKLANPQPYFPSKNKIFSNVTACVTKVSPADAKALFALITYHGGKVKLNLDTQCTHVICGSASGKKYSVALTLPKTKVVTPDWVLESLRARIQAVTEIFHPKLLIVPQPPPKPMDRISAITGFDFEEGIAKNEVPTQNMTENKDESTQALLDKLKQRMPWNHTPSSANSSGVVTSNVNSMGYTTAMSTPSLINKSIPQGIVTQNLQIQASQANAQFIQKMSQNAVVSQPGINQNQQVNIQQSQNYNQNQQQQQQQPHGLSAIQIQQQKLLQQHQLRMQMLQQKIGNQQTQQGFGQSNVSASQMSQNISNQIQQHIQSNQHHIQQQNQNLSQSPSTSMSSAQQQIENISQMLSQSANNLQQAQLSQQNMVMKQGLTLSQQNAVQNIAQQLAQSTQNLQQSLQNAKMNQNLGQSQVLNQQQLINSGQQMSTQNQSLIQQQTVQSLTNQQQNINMGVVNQQGLVSSSQAQSGQGGQLNQLVGNTTQQSVIGQQIQTVQQNMQNQQGNSVPVQGAWRQQNIQMVQNVQGQHQIIRSPLVQSRNPPVLLQQQIMQTQQQSLINNQQPQLSPQHTIQQTSQQILQQSINSQGQTHHQILVQKQQLLNNSGQQQIVQGPQQVLINQHTGQQQILVHGNQQVTLQGGQQLVSQSQIVHQGGQIVNQGGQQIITQGGQHVITQQGQQHQVVIAQPSQQLVTQTVGQTQQVLTQVPQSPQPGQQMGASNIQQIITHSGGQQIVSPGGQQIVQGGQNVSWQQQQYLQQRQQIGQPGAVGPRVSWTAAGGGRQLIHLDAQTHAQLQQMDPQQRAMFVAQLQKRRQLSIQRAAALAQQQQTGVVAGSPGAPSPGPQSVTFIRSQLPPGLSQQQQVQWLQQQGARTATIPVSQPTQLPQSPVGGAVAGSVGSVGAVGGAVAGVETSLQQMQRQQQYQRLQQLQAQRDHAAHHHAAAKQVAPVTQHVVAPLQEQQVDALLTPTTPEQQQVGAGALLVNPKTKTALANMLSIRLQGAAPPTEHEPSAAGTLRLMTAAHAAGGAVRAPTRLLLGPAHHPHQVPTPAGSAGVVGNKVYAGAVRAAPPRAQFYGHNPNLKLPPDLFLLGCVFHIVEYQQSVGAERVSRWAEAIVRRGGEVEAGYCARVTHVLCETQRHGVVMQALRDAKRCVTAYWVADTLERRVVVPPWHALHLPALHARSERPAAHHRAALAGWRRDERRRLACCLRQIGAKLTPYMSRDNTVLVCKRAEGNKYRRAREWGVPVVSAAWITDLLLGNMTALAQVENAKYQQFNLASPFRMDYSLVSHLMNAWKMPINITQESHERAKRSAAAASGRRAKRPRLDPPAPPPAPLAPPQPPPINLAPRVLFSGLQQNDQNRLAAIVRQLGGLVVTSASEATHLIMEKLVRTCKLALRDAKRCVTAYWVADTLERRVVVPPWHALHLPALHARSERPAAHHRAALAGWRRDERRRLACCLRQIGAKLTPYMSRDNTVLVCKRAEGNKYRRAREWGVPVVSAAWITDLLLGNMTALAQVENAKYQQFNLASPFRMDYSLVSHLMNAWKMPINITQESHERAKRSAAAASGRRAKRPRLDPPAPPPAPLAPPQPPPINLAPRVLFSGLQQNDQNRLAAIVRQLGGLVVTSASEATHLIMEKLVRTCKLVSCLITVKHLLSPEWVLESQKLNKFADEAKHGLRDDAFNKMFKCDVDEVLLCGEQRKKLFDGITFFLTPCVKPSRAGLTEMIELCGGKVEKNRRSYVSIQEMHTQKPFSYLVLTVPNDLHLVYYLLQSEKTLNVVCSTEVVLSAIMRQKLQIEEFLVKID